MPRVGLACVRVLAALALCITASRASALSLTITADQAVYEVGDTIHLQIDGDPMGFRTAFIYGRLFYSAPLTETVAASAIQHSSDGTPWFKGSNNFTDGAATIFNQFQFGFTTPDQNSFGTATLIAERAGPVAVNWITGSGGSELHYFALRAAPGTAFLITPEPATSTLLAIGLAAFSAFRRRRAC